MCIRDRSSGDISTLKGVELPPPVSRLHHIDSGVFVKEFLSIIYYQSGRPEASMRKDVFLKLLPFILVVILSTTFLMVTARAESWSWSKVASPAGDCLLYTSPSPRDGLLSRM